MRYLFLVLTLVLSGHAASAEEEPPPEKRLITMNFQDVEIAILAQFISELTGKNFIVDEKVRGKVTVISPEKITVEEAYLVFQSVLQVKGFTTVPSGAVIKIIPTREAKQAALPLGPLPAAGDEFVTRLIPLRHVDATELASTLQPLISVDGLVVPYLPTNTLIIIDAASNIQRLLRMLEELDVEGYERGIEVIRLQHAVATELAEKVEDILTARRSGGAAPARASRPPSLPGAAAKSPRSFRVIADDRTNSLIILAGPVEMKEIKSLVSRLDLPLPAGTSRINVYYLKHANAEELVQVLADLVGAPRAGLAVPRQPTRRAERRQLFGRQEGFPAPPGAQAGARLQQPPAPSRATPGEAAGRAPEFAEEVRVTADPATNALIISASPQDFQTLKEVIDKLDIRRRQVYVEAIILEVSLDKTRQLGIEFQGGVPAREGAGLGRVNLRNLNTALSDPASLSGLILAAASDRTVELPDGTEVPAQVALLTALQADTDINILSAPNLLTTDNQEAEILVGQNIPFIASRATDTTQLTNLFATVQRQDVGVTLRITPQITEGDFVRLDIYEEVSAVVPTTVGDPNLVGPTTSVRSASTTVVGKNGQTVVIGGLISDNITHQVIKVPFLGDIPVLGHLFRTTDDRRSKINLLVFLTPHIIKNEAELAEFSSGEQDRFKKVLEQRGVPPPEQLERPSFSSPLPEEATPPEGSPEP